MTRVPPSEIRWNIKMSVIDIIDLLGARFIIVIRLLDRTKINRNFRNFYSDLSRSTALDYVGNVEKPLLIRFR